MVALEFSIGLWIVFFNKLYSRAESITVSKALGNP